MNDYFEEKDISIKKFFAEQDMEDNEDLLMDVNNFVDLMWGEILREDDEDILIL